MNELKHIGVIADGNGRWATAQGFDRQRGHEEGLHKLKEICQWCVDLKIPILSAYVFALENWNRPKEETDNLALLANSYFDRYPEFIENNIKVLVSGVHDNLEQETIEKMERVQRETAHCDGLVLNLCANYSGRREIIDAIAKGAKTEEELTQSLYHQLPAPDLIIRTGGHKRLSDFLLWEAAYSEFYFTETLFPDLSVGEFRHAVKLYYSTQRNFGG